MCLEKNGDNPEEIKKEFMEVCEALDEFHKSKVKNGIIDEKDVEEYEKLYDRFHKAWNKYKTLD